MKPGVALRWASAAMWLLSVLLGMWIMFEFRPSPDLNVQDTLLIKSTMPVVHWLHVGTGIAAGLGFLALAVLPDRGRWRQRIAWACAAVVIFLVFRSGFAITAGGVPQRTLMTQYQLHVIALPMIVQLGILVLLAVRVRAYVSRRRPVASGHHRV